MVLVDKLGWRLPMLLMAALVLALLLGVVIYQEAPVESAQAITFRQVIAFFRRPRIGLLAGHPRLAHPVYRAAVGSLPGLIR